MPKKRFSSQYSKPQSTAHPSFGASAALEQGSAGNDASPSVNQLISSLRNTQITPEHRPPPTVTTPSLPPQISDLLELPQTHAPAPRARNRWHLDRNGRRIPGPPPPRSWLEGSRHAPPEVRRRNKERVYPHDVDHLPGLELHTVRQSREHLSFGHGTDGPSAGSVTQRNGRTLQDMCLRRMANDWEFIRQYERNNLADLPTRLRMLLLSNIAVYGPEDGVGFEGLRHILMAPETDEADTTMLAPGDNNEGFFRLDLSGSLGWSISFKQLIALVETPIRPAEEAVESWEESFTLSLRPPITHLTHLSLSHPSPTVSWPRLLNFAKHVPTLTHLSLAYWPVPSVAPNSTTTVMSPSRGRDVQYGGTNYYSHSIDLDFREAAAILRRLASTLYSIEYLDLSGCVSWLPALYWKGEGETGIEWRSQWVRLSSLHVQSGYILQPESEFWEVAQYVQGVKEQESLERALTSGRRSKDGRAAKWIDVQKDDWRLYESFWKSSADPEYKRKWSILETLNERD